MIQSAVCDVPVQNGGADGDLRFRPMAYGGHALYVRKCVVGESVAGDEATRQLNGFVLPERFSERTFIGEVLGIGPRVGRPCNALYKKRWDKLRDERWPNGYHRARCLEAHVRVGDFVLLPSDHMGIKRSPLVEYEYYIEESVPLAIVLTETEDA